MEENNNSKKHAMTRRKKVILTAAGYFLNIFVFGTIYFCFWLKNTSNFIINEDFNEVTIKPVFFYDEIPDDFNSNKLPLTTKQANDLMAPLFDSLTLFNRQITIIDNALAKYKIQDSILFNNLWKTHDKNVDVYLKNKLSPFNKSKDSINLIITRLRKKQTDISTSKQDYYSYEIQIAKANYQTSLVDVSIARVNVDVYTEALKDIPKFYDDSLYHKYIDFNNDRLNLVNLRSTALDKVEKTKEEVRVIDFTYHTSRFNKVQFSDFFYFSVITATSTGYGDILPNTKTIRILVSIEIILSLLLFGLFLNWLTTKE